MGSAVAESEEGLEGLPASVALLGMKLGDHARKNSDGKSSMMGLSALGLESHRDSSQQEQKSVTGLDDIEVPDQNDERID